MIVRQPTWHFISDNNSMDSLRQYGSPQVCLNCFGLTFFFVAIEAQGLLVIGCLWH